MGYHYADHPSYGHLGDGGLSLARQRLDNGSHYMLINLRDGSLLAKNPMQAVALASGEKAFFAATILHARGNDFLRDPTNCRMMARFLSRSDNSMGPALARRAFGSSEATFAAMQNLKDALGLDSWNFKPHSGLFDATTGYNSDGKGPMASPLDVSKVWSYLYKQDGGAFLNRFASPQSGVGHTMPYLFAQGGVIGAKSGTNPRAGDYTASFLFKGSNGDPYAAFMHTSDGESRKRLASALIDTARSYELPNHISQLQGARKSYASNDDYGGREQPRGGFSPPPGMRPAANANGQVDFYGLYASRFGGRNASGAALTYG